MSPKACVMTSAHPAFDVRIFHKECRSLTQAGYEVTLIAPHPESQHTHGIVIEAVPLHSQRFRRMFQTTRAVYRAARAVDADIYHFHDPELIPVGLLLRTEGKTVVYDIHEDLPRTLSYKHYIPSWLQKPLEKIIDFSETQAARWFSGLIAATPEIAARFNRKHSKVNIVQNYPLFEEFKPIAAETRRRCDYIAYVGARITKARGVQEMVRALELLPESLDMRLKLVGSIDPPELISELDTMPGWQRTEYLGPLGRTAVAEVIQGATAGLVVLHPERNYVASHPVKLFEYMCAGIPVIASDFPVFRSIVKNAGCGLLVNPLDPGEIADAIQYLWTHPGEARQMGERGRHAVEVRYNWANEEKKLLNMYRQLCDRKAFRSPLEIEST